MSHFARISAATLVTNKYEAEDLAKISDLCQKAIGINAPKTWSYISCFLALFKQSSLRSAYCDFPEFHRVVSQLASENFDLIYIKRLRMAQYAKHFENDKVIDGTDSMGLYYERLCQLNFYGFRAIINNYESKILSNYEKQIAQSYRMVVCSELDSSYIEKSAKLDSGTIKVIPNVVDLDKFQYQAPSSWSNSIKIGFFGIFSASTNEDAAYWLGTDIYPYLKQKFPLLECEIVGLFPSKRLLKLQSLGLRIIGYVPNLSDVVYSWNVFLCPLRSGAGVKNKILQCLAMGVPVIATSLSIEGLVDIQANEHLLLANNVSEFAEQLIRLNNEPELVLNLSQSGRKYVEKYYSLETLENCMKNFLSNY
ncbi:putative Glycosyltransferase [Planktothrix rubescens CCAP 1459/22]|uniref:Glycosyltransferase n=2 Tax=Planktothrix TaxID=54304 RepID=A0A6J7ZEI7_PLARU|nr:MULTISPECIES: glycosyltransferase family 4 protein [Planktothrix]CAC5339780.1 putative Glycosyltransferase [Planktothrix rubescens NIVA-CYA 18]CAD5986457.1 Putative Glycosyltransferase [Planktothrix rubescens NIVA-CYA 18]CAH2575641.1 Putative Glycosyltransferase [Planktothrix rubescens]